MADFDTVRRAWDDALRPLKVTLADDALFEALSPEEVRAAIDSIPAFVAWQRARGRRMLPSLGHYLRERLW